MYVPSVGSAEGPETDPSEAILFWISLPLFWVMVLDVLLFSYLSTNKKVASVDGREATTPSTSGVACARHRLLSYCT